MEENLTTFVKKIISFGGSLGITIPEDIVRYEGLSKEDTIKVMIIKLPKKEDEE